MDVPIVRITTDRHREKYIELISNEENHSDLQNGDYALVKIESLNDRIEVEKFIEQLKNK